MAPHEDANAVLDWYDLPDPDGLDHFLHVDVGTVIGAGPPPAGPRASLYATVGTY
jgi:hypothetical protein